MFTIYLFKKYVFSSYYVPGIRLDPGVLIINKKWTMPNQKVGPPLALGVRLRGLESGNRKAALKKGVPLHHTGTQQETQNIGQS